MIKIIQTYDFSNFDYIDFHKKLFDGCDKYKIRITEPVYIGYLEIDPPVASDFV